MFVLKPKKRACKSSSSREVTEEERKEAEQHLKECMFRYSLPTFMGNWVENKIVKEMQNKKLEDQKAAGDTIPQKQDVITTRIQKPLSLSAFQNYIPFNVPIQIGKYNMKLLLNPKQCNDPVEILSTVITNKQFKDCNIQEIVDTCPIIISSDSSPKRQNVFCIINAYPNNRCNTVLCNQSIMICLQDSLSTTPLYLRCENPTYDTFGVSNSYLPVVLSNVADRFCKFKFEQSIPDQKIMFYPMNQLSSSDLFYITHVCSNRPLVVSNNTITNYLGIKEKTLACAENIYSEKLGEHLWKILFKPEKPEQQKQ